jgi:hypothetical protein
MIHAERAMMQNTTCTELIVQTRERLLLELRQQFDVLSTDAQSDIAVTFLWTMDDVPSLLEPCHRDVLNQTVESLIERLQLTGTAVRCVT